MKDDIALNHALLEIKDQFKVMPFKKADHPTPEQVAENKKKWGSILIVDPLIYLVPFFYGRRTGAQAEGSVFNRRGVFLTRVPFSVVAP